MPKNERDNLMAWANMTVGSMLTKNRDGTLKAEPSLWLPPGKPMFIPDCKHDHARPLVLLTADDPKDTFSLIVYRDQLIGRFRGQEKTLVDFDL